jgi:biofilm PGA synthesis protein PgaA
MRTVCDQDPDNVAAYKQDSLRMLTKCHTRFNKLIFIIGLACSIEKSFANNDALIELARQGNYSPAIAALQAQAKANNVDQTVVSDLVTILGWADRWNEALAAAQQLNSQTAPIYGVKAHALAAKRAGKAQSALELYDIAIARSLPNIAYDLHAAKLQLVCDMNKCLQGVSATEKLLENLPRPELTDSHVLLIQLAKAYIALDRKTEALAIYQRILQVLPQNSAIEKEQTYLLSSMRASLLAKQL